MSYETRRKRSGEGGGRRRDGGGALEPGKRALTDRLRAPAGSRAADGPMGDDLMRPDFSAPLPRARGDGSGDELMAVDFGAPLPRGRRGGDGPIGDDLLRPDFDAPLLRARGGDGSGDELMAVDFNAPLPRGRGDGLGDELLAPEWDAEPLLDPREIARAKRKNPAMYTRLVFDPRRIAPDELDSAAFALVVAEQQQIHGLPVDGIVGRRTLEALGIPFGEDAKPKAPDSLEATRGRRDPEGAADRASGRALERPAEESIEEHRATLSLD